MEMNKTLAVDFDGTIAKYDGWRGKGKFGTPIDGVKSALSELKVEGWTIMIYTTRLEIHQVKEYLDQYKIPYDYINFTPDNISQQLHPSKMRADVYIDDRNVQFKGNWKETLEAVHNFKEWWRK